MHITYIWWPDPSGGTEVYVKGLAAELQKLGVENVIAAPAAGIPDSGFRIQGEGEVRVWRFRCRESGGDLGEIYGEGDPVAAESFKQVLDEEKPDIVHFHAWSPAVSILLVREVKRRGIRMVQTYHTPTLSCPRGTLMRWGRTVCDGDLAKRPCALCAIQGKLIQKHRMPDAGYRIPGAGNSLDVSSLNPKSEIRNPKGSWFSVFASKLSTMLRMPRLIRKRTEVVRELFWTADKIVALNQWTKELLKINGVEQGKIEVIRHGIPDTGFRIRDSWINKQSAEGIEGLTSVSRKDARDAEGKGERTDAGCRISDSGSEEDTKFKLRNSEEALKLVFLGRVAPEKGIDVLLRAMEMVKIPVELDVYGIGAKPDRGERIGPLRPAPAHPIQSLRDAGEIRLRGGIGDSTGGEKPQCSNPEARIRWLEPVKPEAVVETIRKYDALVVPSVCLETGPLVVLEAFAAGVPVIGSRLGGIAEMVEDGVYGVLFQPGDPAALAMALVKFSEKQSALKGNIKKPKEVRRVAEEHSHLYRCLD